MTRMLLQVAGNALAIWAGAFRAAPLTRRRSNRARRLRDIAVMTTQGNRLQRAAHAENQQQTG